MSNLIGQSGVPTFMFIHKAKRQTKNIKKYQEIFYHASRMTVVGESSSQSKSTQ